MATSAGPRAPWRPRRRTPEAAPTVPAVVVASARSCAPPFFLAPSLHPWLRHAVGGFRCEKKPLRGLLPSSGRPWACEGGRRPQTYPFRAKRADVNAEVPGAVKKPGVSSAPSEQSRRFGTRGPSYLYVRWCFGVSRPLTTAFLVLPGRVLRSPHVFVCVRCAIVAGSYSAARVCEAKFRFDSSTLPLSLSPPRTKQRGGRVPEHASLRAGPASGDVALRPVRRAGRKL